LIIISLAERNTMRAATKAPSRSKAASIPARQSTKALVKKAAASKQVAAKPRAAAKTATVKKTRVTAAPKRSPAKTNAPTARKSAGPRNHVATAKITTPEDQTFARIDQTLRDIRTTNNKMERQLAAITTLLS
jgi:hypothetical protein